MQPLQPFSWGLGIGEAGCRLAPESHPKIEPVLVEACGSSCRCPGAWPLCPVALFGRAWWIFTMRRARAGLASARFPQDGCRWRREKRDMSKRVKSGLLHGLGMILGLGRASGNVVANPSHADASAGGAGGSLSHRRQPGRLPAWHDVVRCGRVRLSRLVAWSQHDWPGLRDWVTAAGFSPLAAVETASNRCRQCARML